MENFDNIKAAWQSSKHTSPTLPDATEMLRTAKRNIKEARKHHLFNILILALTCVGLAAFFYYLAPLQDTVSRVGIVFMIGGLAVRILIEAYSHQKSHEVGYDVALIQSSNQAARYYSWRKKVHGPVTISIIALYTIGFYMLTPEFSRYLALPWVIAMDVSYLVIAVVLFFLIRKGVLKEMEHLKMIVDIQKSAQAHQ